MSKYKLIQLTNNDLPDVAVDEYLPFGRVTRRLNNSTCDCVTFQISTSDADIIYLNEPGYYNVTYSASLVAGAAGDVTITLIVNGDDIYTITQTVTEAGTFDVTLPYALRVCPNSCAVPTNCPMSVQLQLGGVAITGGASNIIIEKIH